MTKDLLYTALKKAIKTSILSILSKYKNEHFYYISLITTENALAPCLGIWSYESLSREAKK